jgi:hypothetical protein
MDGPRLGFVYWNAMKYVVRSLLLSLLFVAVLGCDKATPTAPDGSTLTISASPAQIGLNGSSTITIVGRKANGSPLNPGTEIRLSTDRGTIDPIVQVNSSGVATATLRADGRTGAAAVKAAAADVEATTTVQIGQSTENKPSVLVSASPSTAPVQGKSTITIIARNADGSPAAAGQTVILTTSLGTLSNSRPLTQSDGTATTTLNVGQEAGTATVTAILGSSDAGTTTVTIRDAAVDISADADPKTIQRGATTEIEVSAFVFNAQGLPVASAPVQFISEIGSFSDGSVAFTNSSGEATNTLTVRPQDIPTGRSSFQIRTVTPSGTGGQLSSSVTITISG